MSKPHLPGDSISRMATDLAQRIRWEVEHGSPGYPSVERSAVSAVAADPVREHNGVVSPTQDRDSALSALRAELGECTRCPLHQGRQHIVFGEGNANAKLVFVGEGPGRDEDLQGRPFVGAAGQLLSRIIQAISLSREAVYICNVVKCRPPNNRVPNEDECATCGPFMKKQLAIIKPQVVVALGGTAAKYLLGVEAPLGRLRGRFHDADGFEIMPTYHPAYLLRNPKGKRPVWEDMQMVAKALGIPRVLERKT